MEEPMMAFDGDWPSYHALFGSPGDLDEDATNSMLNSVDLDSELAKAFRDGPTSSQGYLYQPIQQQQQQQQLPRSSQPSQAFSQDQSQGQVPLQQAMQSFQPQYQPQYQAQVRANEVPGYDHLTVRASGEWDHIPDYYTHSQPKEKDQADDDVSCDDSECSQIGACPSECGEPGQGSICCNDNDCASASPCLDEGCDEAQVPCTDEHCTSDSLVPEENKEAAAAVALASFGEFGPSPSTRGYDHNHDGNGFYNNFTSNAHQFQTGSMSNLGFDTLPFDTSFNNSQMNMLNPMSGGFDQSLRMDPLFIMGNHYLHCHSNPGQHAAHDHTHGPCIADNTSSMIARCTLPLLDDNFNFQPNQNQISQCGFQGGDMSMWQQHLITDHAPLFNNFGSTMPDFSCEDLAQIPGLQSDGQIWQPSHHAQMPSFQTPSYLESTPASSTKVEDNREGGAVASRPSRSSSLDKAEASPSYAASELEGVAQARTPLVDQETTGEHVCHWRISPNSRTLCLQSFKDTDALDRHCKAAHVKDSKRCPEFKDYRCEWAGCLRGGFPQKGKLTRHIQTHTGWKPLTCPTCGLKLSAKQALEQHIRTHTLEKPFKCTFEGCTQSFKQHSALIMHSRVHTGERPLKCKICGACFRESSNLTKHRRTHENKGQFQCRFCNKDFHRRDQLRRHLGNNHKDKPIEVAEALVQVQDWRREGKQVKRRKIESAPTTAATSPGAVNDDEESMMEDVEMEDVKVEFTGHITINE